jgi:hypothetical protein
VSSLPKQFGMYRRLFAIKSYRRRVAVTILALFGATSSVSQVILWAAGINGGAALTYSLIVLIPVGTFIALRTSLPSASMSFRHSAIDSTLRVSVGDLFDSQGGTTLITMNRHFDTSPKWVADSSLIAQLLKGPLSGNSSDIRSHILKELQCEHEEERQVGEIVRVCSEQGAYLLMAVADRNEETSSAVAVDAVWLSLSRLWKFARQSNTTRLRLPIVGSGFARAHVGRIPLLVLLLTSYLTSAMELPICDLEIVIHPDDADPDLLELTKSYCELLGYKVVTQRPFADSDLSSS